MTPSRVIEAMVNPKRISLLPIEIPLEALAVYNSANLALKAKLRRPSAVDGSAVASQPSQSVGGTSSIADQDDATPTDPKTEWFSKLTSGEQRKELRRLIGLSRLGLNDDRVAEIMRTAITRTRSEQSKR
jgi:hypothetical protein